MKINQYGVVILTEGPVKVEGWNVEREPNDPKDATDEQLLLGFAIVWARERLLAAVNSSAMDVFRKAANQKLLAASLPKLAKKSEAVPGEQMVDILAHTRTNKPS